MPQPLLTTEDLERISSQDDSHRYELLDGVLKVSPSNPRHDRTRTRISSRLDTHTEQNGLGIVLSLLAHLL
ncbi:MAG: Uma2 family endonuclease [Chloroflexi bacterium]|nr:Uma2 family endonuclease [Chloroflexota bacterium]